MNFALILSGGTGTRLGSDIPKQYIEIYGKPIIKYSFETIVSCDCIDAVFIVAAKEWHDYLFKHLNTGKFYGFVDPGDTRQLSVYNGLIEIRTISRKSDDIVLIHDAARPLVKKKMIIECVNALNYHDGVLPILPMKDTIYYSKNGVKIDALLKRENLFAGQAPEAFKLKKYLMANEGLMPRKIMQIRGSTEPAVLAGLDIVMINGDEDNFKITTKKDLIRFEEIMREKNESLDVT